MQILQFTSEERPLEEDRIVVGHAKDLHEDEQNVNTVEAFGTGRAIARRQLADENVIHFFCAVPHQVFASAGRALIFFCSNEKESLSTCAFQTLLECLVEVGRSESVARGSALCTDLTGGAAIAGETFFFVEGDLSFLVSWLVLQQEVLR